DDAARRIQDLGSGVQVTHFRDPGPIETGEGADPEGQLRSTGCRTPAHSLPIVGPWSNSFVSRSIKYNSRQESATRVGSMVRAEERLGTELLRALLSACCAFLFLSAGALAQEPSQEDISSGKYCSNCHANALVIWGGKHGTKADSRAPVSVGCLMCHGDPSEHVKNPASPMPRRFSKMASAEKNEICLTCHQGRTRMHWEL